MNEGEFASNFDVGEFVPNNDESTIYTSFNSVQSTYRDTTCDSKTVSMEEYQRLYKSMIDLLLANETIEKLEDLILKKNTKISKLEAAISEKSVHLSVVS